MPKIGAFAVSIKREYSCSFAYTGGNVLADAHDADDVFLLVSASSGVQQHLDARTHFRHQGKLKVRRLDAYSVRF